MTLTLTEGSRIAHIAGVRHREYTGEDDDGQTYSVYIADVPIDLEEVWTLTPAALAAQATADQLVGREVPHGAA